MKVSESDRLPSVLILYYGGSSGDLQDTLEWVSSLKRVVAELGGESVSAEVNRNNWHRQIKLPGEVVFNLVEDEDYGLYMKVAKALDRAGRVQAGIGSRGFEYLAKKSAAKRRMVRLGLSTPEFLVLKPNCRTVPVVNMKFPLIVKPSGQHAAVGISQGAVVTDQEELTGRIEYLRSHYPGEVVIEEYIDGREFHITVIGNGKDLTVLPPAEVTFRGRYADNWNVYTYEAKWEKTSWEYRDARVLCPARLPSALHKKLEESSLEAYTGFGCCDFARFDFRVDGGGRQYLIDVNMCPSLNEKDEEDASIRSARAYGWSYKDLVEKVIRIAYKRNVGDIPDRIPARYLVLPPEKI